MHVQLHFQQTLPVLEREHRAPEEPEVALQEACAEVVLDGHIIEVFLALEHQLDQFPLLRLAQPERGEVLDLPLLVHQPGLGIVRVVVVHRPVLVEHAVAGRQLQGRHVLEQVPEIVVVPVHLAAAANQIALLGVAGTIERTAFDVQAVDQGDVRRRHAAIADQVERSGQASDTGADDPRLARRHALRCHRAIAHVGAHHVRRRQRVLGPVAPVGPRGIGFFIDHRCPAHVRFLDSHITTPFSMDPQEAPGSPTPGSTASLPLAAPSWHRAAHHDGTHPTCDGIDPHQ